MGHSALFPRRREAEQDGVNERRELILPTRTEQLLFGQTEMWWRREWNGCNCCRCNIIWHRDSNATRRLGGIVFGGSFSSMVPRTDPKNGSALQIFSLLSFYVPAHKDIQRVDVLIFLLSLSCPALTHNCRFPKQSCIFWQQWRQKQALHLHWSQLHFVHFLPLFIVSERTQPIWMISWGCLRGRWANKTSRE